MCYLFTYKTNNLIIAQPFSYTNKNFCNYSPLSHVLLTRDDEERAETIHEMGASE